MEGTRQWLAEPLDGFVDLSPRLTLVRSWDRDHQVSASYRQRDRRFDTRTAVDLDGDPIVGRLRVAQHEVEVNWRRTWGATRAWRASLRAGWVQSADNGVGYLDYERVTGASTLRWAKGRWEWRGEFRSRWYRYAVQESDSLAGGPRRRWEAGYSLRGEWKMRDSLTWFGQYEGELTDENVSAGDYRVNALSGGLEWEW